MDNSKMYRIQVNSMTQLRFPKIFNKNIKYKFGKKNSKTNQNGNSDVIQPSKPTVFLCGSTVAIKPMKTTREQQK